MKILLATGLYPPEVGGPATYTKLIEAELSKHRFEIVVLPFSRVRHLPKLVRHAAYFWKCFWLARKVDIVYAQDPVSVGLPALVAAKLAGKKFLVRVPGDYAWEQARQRFGVSDELDLFQTKKYNWRVELLRRMQRLVVRRARAIVVPSEYMKQVVSGWLDARDSGKIQVIYSSIAMPETFEIERPAGFLVVSSGRRVPWKGFDAIARVVAREKQWHFFLAEDLPRQQALSWVRAADVFVLNSTYEGLSHALVEAMMLGTPVVATRVGGNPELVEDGVTGLLVPPRDDEALYASIKSVEQHQRAARERAERAKARANAFSIHTTIEKLIQLLNTL